MPLRATLEKGFSAAYYDYKEDGPDPSDGDLVGWDVPRVQPAPSPSTKDRALNRLGGAREAPGYVPFPYSACFLMKVGTSKFSFITGTGGRPNPATARRDQAGVSRLVRSSGVGSTIRGVGRAAG